MNFLCISELEKALCSHFSCENIEITPEICSDDFEGDITVNCFKLASKCRNKPDIIAEFVANFLDKHKDVIKTETIKAFVNIVLKPEAIYEVSVANVPYILRRNIMPSKKILIEYSAPNTNKPLHLGHVRNNVIGMSLVNLLTRVGYNTIPVNLINDRGIHICKAMIAYQKFGNGITPESSGIKGDHLVGNFYVKFDMEFRRQITEFKKNNPEYKDKSDEELFLRTEIGREAQEMLQKWELKDKKICELWKKLREWVLEGFDETYKKMGVKFVHTYFESDIYLSGRDIVYKGLEKGIFYKRKDGAIVADLGRLGEKVLLRSDGTSVYITQDIGATIKKYEDFHPDMQIWVVGDEQILHFKMLFAILKKLELDKFSELYHLPYGMVNLPSGKMKSREGTVVDADDLIEKMIILAKNAILERYKNNMKTISHYTEENKNDINKRAEIIGLGALKFMLLKFNSKTSVMFNPDAAIKFEGDTGPYIQYACARINSIERKASEQGIKNIKNNEIQWNLMNSSEEKSLALQIFLYPEVLKNSAERMDCSILASYLLNTAKSFSKFYKIHSVLNAETEKLKYARLAMCFAVRDILTDGLKILAIDVPDIM